MHPQLESRNQAAGPSMVSIIEAGGPAAESVAASPQFSTQQKHFLQALCERLEKDPTTNTVNAACRELRRAIDAAGAPLVADAKAPAARPVPQPRRGVPAGPTSAGVRLESAAAEESLPKSDDVVLTRNLVDMGMGQVRQRCTRFGTQVDRLLALVPQSMHTLRERLISLRDRHATPSTGFDGQHAEMLEVGHHVLTLLCNEFKKLDPAKHRMALNLLAMSVPQWNYLGSHVRGLVNALIDVESTDTGEHNPHLNERRKRFEDWAEPLMASSRLTENDFRRGMEALGLDTDHNLDVERMDPWLHPVYNIAAWQACLEIPFDPNDLPPLADVGKADLILALDALRQRCEGLRMDTAALDRFSDNWLAKKPSGERRDSVAELQGVGVDALWEINKYLAGKDGRTAKLEMLAHLFRALKNAENPATELFDRAQRTKA